MAGDDHPVHSTTHRPDRELWDLVVEIDGLIAPEITELRDLVAQIGNLVKHAADDLQGRFVSLAEAIQAQEKLVTNLVASAPQTDSSDSGSAPGTELPEREPAGIDELTVLSTRLREDLNATVRLLQFEDITQQVLERIRLRIDFMDRFVAELRRLPLVDSKCSAEQLEQARQRLMELREALHAAVHRSVRQSSMNAGEIELF